MSQGASMIASERERQRDEERYGAGHDEDHDDASLTRAAVCYAELAAFQIKDAPFAPVCRPGTKVPIQWPWDSESYKPKDVKRNLVRAGALIAAELDRILLAEFNAELVAQRRAARRKKATPGQDGVKP